jgi:hypothetical protein
MANTKSESFFLVARNSRRRHLNNEGQVCKAGHTSGRGRVSEEKRR